MNQCSSRHIRCCLTISVWGKSLLKFSDLFVLCSLLLCMTNHSNAQAVLESHCRKTHVECKSNWICWKRLCSSWEEVKSALSNPRAACGPVRGGSKTYESNFFYHDFVQFGKQHSRYKAILPYFVLSQQCYEAYSIPLTEVNRWWDLAVKDYWNRPPLNLLAGCAPGPSQRFFAAQFEISLQ